MWIFFSRSVLTEFRSILVVFGHILQNPSDFRPTRLNFDPVPTVRRLTKRNHQFERHRRSDTMRLGIMELEIVLEAFPRYNLRRLMTKTRGVVGTVGTSANAAGQLRELGEDGGCHVDSNIADGRREVGQGL